MTAQHNIETWVGFFILVAILALVMLAFKVSGLTSFFTGDVYEISAYFDNIGGLKLRAPVKVGGVAIGEVTQITLDPASFRAIVRMQVSQKYADIPSDSSASILTAGLLGDNYIELTPMYGEQFLKQGSVIQDTHPALVLEKLIGQFLFKVGGGQNDKQSTTTQKSSN